VFTARYARSPYIKQIRFFFKGLILWTYVCWISRFLYVYSCKLIAVSSIFLFIQCLRKILKQNNRCTVYFDWRTRDRTKYGPESTPAACYIRSVTLSTHNCINITLFCIFIVFRSRSTDHLLAFYSDTQIKINKVIARNICPKVNHIKIHPLLLANLATGIFLHFRNLLIC
jgi:hypothetical protein